MHNLAPVLTRPSHLIIFIQSPVTVVIPAPPPLCPSVPTPVLPTEERPRSAMVYEWRGREYEGKKHEARSTKHEALRAAPNDVMLFHFRLVDHAESLFPRIITVASQNRQFLLAALMPHFTLYLLCANLNVEIGYG
ncbi:hypothetical protein F2P81_010128 [Scophthalmus maximus]|uniref:Uncharacterized protein n=1 Tax=Scophthalmus maximus TaxID=52904 RepID=A0A6A4T209_SCOMX|nr:hypothetical protein F2P81_010128 [Scophthalmus maximus]